MEQYGSRTEEVLARLHADERGLSSSEAQRRLSETGRNVLKEGKKKSPLGLFFSQFKDLMTLILIAAAVLSGVLAYLTRDGAELVDTGILLFVILLNAVVGFLQEYRADSALEKLKKLSRCEAKAVRDGTLKKIDAEELVPGDVVEIEEGDRIPADCRILSSEDLRCDESALTGESAPVKKGDCVVKKQGISDRKNTVFLSTYCVKGSARCVVTETGMNTEMGKIARYLSENAPRPSPLDRAVAKLGKIVTAAVLAVALLLFAGGMLAGRAGVLENLMSAVAVAVAAIPEGMGAVVTVILAMGVQRMAKSRAVMRRLSSVETLGSCNVICTDKTGTLTKNRMTVEEIAPLSSAAEEELLKCIRVCHTVKGSAGGYMGDPTEVALLEYADRRGFSYSAVRTGGIPFSSERKMMSVFVRDEQGSRLYVKGGAEVLLAKCKCILRDGGEVPLTESERREIVRRAADCSARAMRVLGFAYGRENREEDLVFLGFCGMLDPPKEGVREAVETCRRAGIKTVMITGDSADTAYAIASRLGIASSRAEVITGAELDEDESLFEARAERYSVYARVSPKHKSEIVRALQKKGRVVAMTGDGVNDAPALKCADIGVAMGSGTDVTKNSADMVLADDDFSTMVRAVEEGRNIFFNIKKTISFFLATNLAEVLSVLIATLFLWKLNFLTSTQLLFVNLITDSLPVLALGAEKTEGVMLRPPVQNREIFSKGSLLRILFFGVLQTAILIALFLFSNMVWGNAAASTMAFVTLSLLELFHGFNVKNEDTVSGASYFSNPALLITTGVGMLLPVLLSATPLCALFGLTRLSLLQWAIVFAASFAIVPAGMVARGVQKLRLRRRRAKKPFRQKVLNA